METICIVGNRWDNVSKFVCKWCEMGKNVSKFDKDFITKYDEYSVKGDIFEVDLAYPKNVLNLHNDLPFVSERIKIKKMKFACMQFV